VRIVVLGETTAVAGFILAGATVVRADDPGAVRRAWAALPADTAVVVLSAAAASALGGAAAVERDGLLTIAMPR
jgi:vacuolar-type H+-ATPase subunit F/Vma7